MLKVKLDMVDGKMVKDSSGFQSKSIRITVKVNLIIDILYIFEVIKLYKLIYLFIFNNF